MLACFVGLLLLLVCYFSSRLFVLDLLDDLDLGYLVCGFAFAYALGFSWIFVIYGLTIVFVFVCWIGWVSLAFWFAIVFVGCVVVCLLRFTLR